MNIEDFNKYTDSELFDIRDNLVNENISELPNEIINFIQKEKSQIGSILTSISRCVRLIDVDIVRRFLKSQPLKNQITDEVKNLYGYIDTPIGRRKYPQEVVDSIKNLKVLIQK